MGLAVDRTLAFLQKHEIPIDTPEPELDKYEIEGWRWIASDPGHAIIE